MRSARLPVIYALVLVLVLTSGAGGLNGSQLAPEPAGPSPTPGSVTQPINETAAILAINSSYINETTTEAVTLDVGGSLALGTSDLDGEFQSEWFVAAYGQANSSEREPITNNALNRSEQKLKTLKDRQKVAIAAYNNDEISTQTFLRRLALIASDANEVNVFVETINEVAERSNIEVIQHELETLNGPVRSLLQNTLQGDRDAPTRYFVRTTDHGVVLATIHDGSYHREAFLSGARSIPIPNGINDTPMAIRTAKERYPYVGDSGFNALGPGDFFRLYSTYPHGNLTTFLDKNSGKIFYEKQNKQISSDRTAGKQSTTGAFTMTVWTTHEGGPLIVELTKAENDDTLNGSIAIGNDTIGVTGDGKLYMLQPAGETKITASVDGQSVSMTIGNNSTKSRPT